MNEYDTITFNQLDSHAVFHNKRRFAVFAMADLILNCQTPLYSCNRFPHDIIHVILFLKTNLLFVQITNALIVWDMRSNTPVFRMSIPELVEIKLTKHFIIACSALKIQVLSSQNFRVIQTFHLTSNYFKSLCDIIECEGQTKMVFTGRGKAGVISCWKKSLLAKFPTKKKIMRLYLNRTGELIVVFFPGVIQIYGSDNFSKWVSIKIPEKAGKFLSFTTSSKVSIIQFETCIFVTNGRTFAKQTISGCRGQYFSFKDAVYFVPNKYSKTARTIRIRPHSKLYNS